jgi:hypothetical protein
VCLLITVLSFSNTSAIRFCVSQSDSSLNKTSMLTLLFSVSNITKSDNSCQLLEMYSLDTLA